MNVVHVTHEAVEKIGGIGAVITGLVTADAYAERVTRTVLLGPLLSSDRPVNLRLGEGGKVLYSSLDGLARPPWRELFRPIEKTHDVGIIYGTRRLEDPYTGKSVEVEVLLVDVFHSNRPRLNLFKGELYAKFNVPSRPFEDIWEYEQYVRLAEPGCEALKAIGCHDGEQRTLLLAHEYMGMPTALKAILDGAPDTRTVFYAHEVASVRPIVERREGHDTMFYNVLERASADGASIEEVFPEVRHNYKHPLVKAARYCDHVFAVGDFVRDEMRFLDPHLRQMEIDLVYNGVPALPLSLEDKKLCRSRMCDYAEALFGRHPTWIFTHVARPVLSKALWRDLAVMHELEPLLAGRGESAAYFMLGTLAGQRRPQDVRQMERTYGWPVVHERGYPDLCQGEEVIGENVEYFNRGHEHIRAVFVNQWDWNRRVCGNRMPEAMDFGDIRRGSDVEFGLSVYEPFGIAPFEPLCFGATCVTSNVCGCMGFARRVASDEELAGNIVEGDFLQLDDDRPWRDLLNMPREVRERIETDEARRIAGRIDADLPRDDETMRRRIEAGHQLAARMSWENVVREYLLPSLDRVVAES